MESERDDREPQESKSAAVCETPFRKLVRRIRQTNLFFRDGEGTWMMPGIPLWDLFLNAARCGDLTTLCAFRHVVPSSMAEGLSDAAKAGQEAAVRFLLEDTSMMPPLYLREYLEDAAIEAIASGHTRIAQYLYVYAGRVSTSTEWTGFFDHKPNGWKFEYL